MSKTHKKQKIATLPQPHRPPPEGQDTGLGGLDWGDVQTAIEVITFLAARPELFESKPFRALRAAVHPLVMLQLRKCACHHATTFL